MPPEYRDAVGENRPPAVGLRGMVSEKIWQARSGKDKPVDIECDVMLLKDREQFGLRMSSQYIIHALVDARLDVTFCLTYR